MMRGQPAIERVLDLVGGRIVLAIVTSLAALTMLKRDADSTNLVHTAGIVTLVAVAAGVWLYRRGDDLPPLVGRVEPWWFIGGGIALLVIGGSGPTAPPGLAPIPATGNALWFSLFALGAYPLLSLGVMRLVAARVPDRQNDILVEAGLTAISVALVLWVWVKPDMALGTNQIGLTLVRVALPSLDAGLLMVMARLMLLPGNRPKTYRYLALAIAYLFGAHLCSTIVAMAGHEIGRPTVNILFICAFGFTGVAAMDPSMRDLFAPLSADTPLFSAGHLALVIGAMMIGPIVIVIQVQSHATVSPTMAVGAAVFSLVIAAYVATLLRDRAATEHRARHDELTGLPNRTLLYDRLDRALSHARRNGTAVTVMFVDLDRFKEVNDTFGHAAGDELLSQTAFRLKACVRDEDTVARLGGDEFALLLPHVNGFEGSVTVAERVMDAFKAPFSLAEQRMVVTPSMGVAIYPEDGTDPQELLANADTAMYRAKEMGRNSYEIYSTDLQTRAHERLQLEAALRRGLENGELVLHYQPKIDLATRKIVGAEALVRWEHPEEGLLLPGHFVPLAEQSGLVVALGETVLNTACDQQREWQQEGLRIVPVSVNVSARQFRHGVVDMTASVLRRTGLDPKYLELELTESAAVDSLELTAAALAELREIGVSCSIDDFGTGYSSLSYLSRLPIDNLKIDKSFIQAQSLADASIVAAIIAMAHSLGLKVVAEGVETEEQLAYLAEKHCDEVQGFLFSKPVPADEFRRMLAGGSRRVAPVSDGSLVTAVRRRRVRATA
ncbi:MAG TPA: EAL domain-containing protein [Acidimicrobiales bacterium]|nr:EAL domain-containing protein [Acidimicrobiales bacterium]